MTNAVDRDQWRRASELFHRMVELPENQRPRALAEACGSDVRLRRDVEALLAADAADGPLDGPPVPDRVTRPRPEDVDLQPGAAIGPFRLIHELGRGGMGVVWLAERADGAFEHHVALKLIKRGLDTDDVLSRFRRERQILAHLAHPHIARLLDGGATDDGRPWLAMEAVDGEPITAWCDARRLSIEDRLQLLVTACDTVGFAHRNLVVHRDLKPSNMLVTADSDLRLLDFGIAKLLGEDSDENATELGRGPLTPEYAAPEQLTGEPITTATDVYSLGIVLFELLVGVRPDTGNGRRPPSRLARTVDAATAERRATTPDRLQRRLSGDLDAILLKALEPDPGRRYSSAEALAADLRRHLDGRPVHARRPTAAYRARRFILRHRLGVAASTALALSLIGGMISTAWQARLAARQAATAAAVKDFIIDIFQVSDPSQSLGERITARELLDRGAQRVESELADQPRVQSELELVVGDLYRRLGLYDAAEPLLVQARDRVHDLTGDASPEYADTLVALGLLRERQGRFDEADQLHRQALAIFERTAGQHSFEVSEILSALAVDRSGLGDDAGAEALHRRTLELDRELHGEASQEVATDLDNLAMSLWKQERLDEAEIVVRRALAIQRQVLGPDHPDVYLSLHNLGLVLTTMARYPEAEEVLGEAVAGRRRVLGPDHPELANSLDALEAVRVQTGNFNEALKAGAEALAIRRRVLGPDHPDTATSVNSWAVLCYRLADLECAEQGFRDALDIFRRTVGEDSQGVATTINNLGVVVLIRGRLDEASQLLHEALDRRRRLANGPSAEVAQTLTALGRLELDRQRPTAAAGLLNEALATSREVYPPRHPRLADVLVTSARLQMIESDSVAALTDIDEALSIRREVLGTDDPRTAQAEVVEAAVLAALGRTTEAESELAHAASILADRPWVDLDALRCLESFAADGGSLATTAARLVR